MTPSPAIAVFLSLLVSLAGWRARALTAPGAVFAVSIGVAILLGAGWAGGAALLAFFAGSSVISAAPDPAHRDLDAKGTQRDAWQVLANGGAAALLAIAGLLLPGPGIWAVTTSLAAAAADTWATSIGARSASWPRDLLTGQPVPPGTSGGVTSIGSLGAIAGALTVASAAAVVSGKPGLVVAGVLVGTAGMFVDSILGSRWQARFHCPSCKLTCERPVHRCGTKAVHSGGWRRLDNDTVNALATLAAGLAGWGIGLAWGG
ncbi:MAG: DUF92 domain-containing protein [Gemmatimonadota bacterium]